MFVSQFNDSIVVILLRVSLKLFLPPFLFFFTRGSTGNFWWWGALDTYLFMVFSSFKLSLCIVYSISYLNLCVVTISFEELMWTQKLLLSNGKVCDGIWVVLDVYVVYIFAWREFQVFWLDFLLENSFYGLVPLFVVVWLKWILSALSWFGLWRRAFWRNIWLDMGWETIVLWKYLWWYDWL